MAPFGKSFLKARLKNRATPPQAVGGEVPVTVCGEEKAVCGVTKHTTCADMIQALLDDHRSASERKRVLRGEAGDFCLVERWRGFERALPPLTRILRLWSAWGDQRPLVHFVLCRTSDLVQQPIRKGGRSRSKQGRGQHAPHTPPHAQHAPHAQPVPLEKQKRIVRKAFRKLERLQARRDPECPGSEEVQRMVQLILQQDHTIQEQIRRLRDLDLEIQRCHVDEQEEAGPESPPAPAGGPGSSGERGTRLQECPSSSDGVQQLELQVRRHQDLILELTRDIDAELRSQENDQQAAAPPWVTMETDESLCAAELEGLQAELRRSLLRGVALHQQASQLDQQLRLCDAALASRDQECWQLAAHLSSLQVDHAQEEEHAGSAPLKGEAPCADAQTAPLKHGPSPPDGTDTDSDTGISSTHSRDSLSPCPDGPPPLDTDV
ncbi:ras association domain-containing protein 9 [Antennarius striatus]|uniref:ras association domain-containing protein 9 n=1 Tax=Antennarius striatus TaxID=241820 RepID=UPI0035B069D9